MSEKFEKNRWDFRRIKSDYCTGRQGEKKDMRMGDFSRLECNYRTRRQGEIEKQRIWDLDGLAYNCRTRRQGEKKILEWSWSMKYEVRSMKYKFEFLPSNFLLRKLCGTLCKSLSTLWLNLAGLVNDDVIICVWNYVCLYHPEWGSVSFFSSWGYKNDSPNGLNHRVKNLWPQSTICV